MAQVNSLECFGDSYFSGESNIMTGTLSVEGYPVYPVNEIYPVGSVFWSTTNGATNQSIIGDLGLGEKLGSITIGSTTVYAYRRTS